MREPKVLNKYLKGSLDRCAIPMPDIAKSDPFWLKEDRYRAVHTQETLLGPTMPIYEAYNPAIAKVVEHVFSIAEYDVMNNGISPEAAIDKAFKRAETIFAKYQIVHG
jgi:multiple sugar transport system substrate-binding protein